MLAISLKKSVHIHTIRRKDMTEFTNGYFQTMREIANGYYFDKPIRDTQKAILIENGDEEGLKAWNEREKSLPFPFTQGYMNAFHAWEENTKHPAEIFTLERLFCKEEAHDFIACLREAGVSEFAITDRSADLMDLVHAFEKEGCTMKGQCEVKYSDNRRKAKTGILVSL